MSPFDRARSWRGALAQMPSLLDAVARAEASFHAFADATTRRLAALRAQTLAAGLAPAHDLEAILFLRAEHLRNSGNKRLRAIDALLIALERPRDFERARHFAAIARPLLDALEADALALDMRGEGNWSKAVRTITWNEVAAVTPQSVAVITAFACVDAWSTPLVHDFFAACQRMLRPGGVLLLEAAIDATPLRDSETLAQWLRQSGLTPSPPVLHENGFSLVAHRES